MGKIWFWILIGFTIGIVSNSIVQIEKEANGYQIVREKEPTVEPVKIPSHISLKNLPVKERKRKFIEILLPLIKKANREVLEERKFLIKISRKKELNTLEKRKLNFLFKKYKAKTIDELLEKVNIVPPSLILTQGAVESGWGTSRFFTEANNIFGIYSFKGAKCIRAKESNACLKVYDNLLDSVRDYIYNLNVSWAYKRFRKLRSRGADVYTLLRSLGFYSTKRDEYSELLEKVLLKNNLQRFDSIELASNSLQFRE